MSKSVLVIDSPRSCITCPLGVDKSIPLEVAIQCAGCGKWAIDNETETVPDWCPLRPVPPYEDSQNGQASDVALGWDRCLDAILKGE